jgi:hypothetical protein
MKKHVYIKYSIQHMNVKNNRVHLCSIRYHIYKVLYKRKHGKAKCFIF